MTVISSSYDRREVVAMTVEKKKVVAMTVVSSSYDRREISEVVVMTVVKPRK